MKTVIKSEIADALKSVGLHAGDSVMVHTSLGRIGYVCGGAQTVIICCCLGQECRVSNGKP